MALEVAEPVKSITDQFAGTGGLLRASAEALRKADKTRNSSGGTAATSTRSLSRASQSTSMSGTSDRAGAGQFSFGWPMGVASDGSGNLWISDTGNNRVQKWG